MSDHETILCEIDGNLATVALNRPDSLNGITGTLNRELHACLREVAVDERIRVVIFTGAGRGFCPGVDLKASASGEPQEPNKEGILPHHDAAARDAEGDHRRGQWRLRRCGSGLGLRL